MAKVLGMGNALVDIMIRLESDDFLEKFSLPKGSMQLVSNKFMKKILEKSSYLTKYQSSGGSAANTIHGLAILGIKTAFIGKIGNDEFGNFFRADLEKNNIEPNLFLGETETGRAVALISPDSERTFATFLGAAIELSGKDLTSSLFENYQYFHIEGYLMQNHDLIKKALHLAKENNLLVSLDLASFNVIEENLDFLKSLINDYADIVFANEEEAKAFTGKKPEEALQIMAGKCKIAVVKLGKNGSLIQQKDKIFRVGVIPVKSIDTTGAGDLYASGFLYGLIKGLSLQKCGETGSILSGKVIEVTGSKMDLQRWSEIKNLIENLTYQNNP